MKLARSFAVATTALAIILASAPARAENQIQHFKFYRALVSNPLDSVLVTLSTTSFDTTDFITTSNLNARATSSDTSATSGPVTGGANGSIVAHAPKSGLFLVVEVTGALQSQDSLYVGIQYSQGSTSRSDGSYGNPSGDQNNPNNWRWYDGNLTSAGGLVVTQTGSKTFVYNAPAINNANWWATAKAIRFIIQGDNTASALAFSTRAWLVWRDNPN